MVVPLTGAGSWGVRLGHHGGWENDVLSILGGTATTNVLSGAQAPTRQAQAEADYAAGTADYNTIDGIASQVSAFQSAAGVLPSYLQQLAINETIAIVNLDTPLASKTLQAALQVLTGQMVANSTSIPANTVAAGAQTQVGSPTGNPIFVFVIKDGAGRALQFVFPETITALITQDAQGGATTNQEPYSLIGQNAQSNMQAFDWLSTKYGSGVSASGNLIDGTQNNSAGNLLYNSDFQTYSNANLPDNWVAATGAVGTQILNGTTSNAYTTGGGSLEMAGDGATLTAVTQTFNTPASTGLGTGGTPATLLAGTINNAVYIVNGWLKVSATPGAGTVEIALVNGSGTIIQDDSGNNNSFTKSLTAVSTSFVNVNGAFRLPAVLPSTIKLRIRQSVAIDNGKNIFFGRFSMTQAPQIYQGGPYVAGFSGNTAVNASGITPDQWTFAITNTVSKFSSLMWRWFNPPSIGIYFPTSGSPTIGDGLVV
jgi:hypothetical protein